MNPRSEFAFLLEASPRTTSSSDASPNHSLPALRIPPGESYLAMREDGEPLVTTECDPSHATPLFRLAPVRIAQLQVLLLVPVDGKASRVNGSRVPEIALLKPGDQLSLDPRFQLHVALVRRPYQGTPPQELIGKQCPVCTVPFESQTTIFLCPCGTGLHDEGDDRPAEVRLECAKLASLCPGCQQPMDRKESISTVPDV